MFSSFRTSLVTWGAPRVSQVGLSLVSRCRFAVLLHSQLPMEWEGMPPLPPHQALVGSQFSMYPGTVSFTFTMSGVLSNWCCLLGLCPRDSGGPAPDIYHTLVPEVKCAHSLIAWLLLFVLNTLSPGSCDTSNLLASGISLCTIISHGWSNFIKLARKHG